MATRAEREAKYGLREGDYEVLLDMNGGVCWICCNPETIPNRRLAIDHCHTTGQVRGLLCTRCKQVLGRMEDDPDMLRRMADYVEKSRGMFADCCSECPDDVTPYPPIGVNDTDGNSTRFWYRCDAGHLWTCGYLTRGTTWMWMP